MPKSPDGSPVQAFYRDGCLSPVRAMSAERAQHSRERFEALEARVPDPHILDIFEELIGPNLRCWSMAHFPEKPWKGRAGTSPRPSPGASPSSSTRAYEKAMALRGRVVLSVDFDASRERRRR